MKTFKDLGLNKAGELHDKTIITSRELSNSHFTIPEGFEAKVTKAGINGHISIEGKACECCHVSISVSHLRYDDIESVVKEV